MSLTEEQLSERHTGIGGSDAAPAMGLSPHKSALELFLDKRERRELTVVQSEAMRWGHLLEPVIRQEYAERTKRIVRLPTGTLRHAKHPFMLAHIDGVTDDQRIFEAKTSRSDEGWGKTGTDQVPHHYLVQVQHYMAVTGLSVADIAVLIGGNDFRIYEIPADSELQGMIIDAEQDFWHRVEIGKPPEPDYERTDIVSLMRRLFPGTNGATITANEEDASYQRTYDHAVGLAKNYEKVAEGARAHLLFRMGESSRMIFPDGGVQLQRKLVERKAYQVAASSYIDARFSKLKD